MADNLSRGIAIDKISIKKSDFKAAEQYKEATQSHRDEGHTFHILEKGTVIIEIDFQQYTISAPYVVYMHPNQVHRILDFTNMTVCSLAIKNENLNPDYLTFLEELLPAKPLALTKETYSEIFETFSLCFKFSKQTHNKLHHLLLNDSCNALVALIISAFLSREKPSNKLSRAELITKSFRQLLEKNYYTIKRPTEYAKQLNISTHYLNESVKNTTGTAVSQHIQERIILEAKRLLYHTDKSVKEIAFELGYDDYPYFSRLFSKRTGMSALNFRNKRHD
ncbi:AraC-like DNA-binding protein [Chitinophaga polysaccharea]|uniref:AraC-like DNA-binding protein n=1 Tax=Chitinophaga polysaccharea TaxID=1293035 RepID=A0A561PR62_9BACT|nr:helix-turn-helix domain-containing protein [Chitinophaga polysaccharea]TWF40583.1 AraC-like DNA-binding protein [Chitinophaga polysaccharea]